MVEQAGRIRILENGAAKPGHFLDIRDLVHSTDLGEPGLLSMAFAPDYERSRRFYVFYVQNDGDIRIEEVRRSVSNPDRADRSTRRRVLEIEHSSTEQHYGGQLQFGPDRLLYVSVGDGGGRGDPRGRGQRLDTLLGKILRIDPRRRSGRPGYTVPATNPFAGRARPEIWSYGLRNPWRFSFDRATGAFWLGDVGQSRWEEIDFSGARRRARGANFGWSCFEGRHRFKDCEAPGHVPPVIEYSHAGLSCSVTGGYVLRDRGVQSLYGRYLYGDFCTGAIHAARRREGRIVENRYLDLVVPNLSSFAEDSAGRIYAISRRGIVYQLRATR